jgi:hypothetical protein
MQRSPIIFIHYGNSPYLEYSLTIAKNKNPYTRVILLGDDSNKAIALQAGAEHFYFENYFKEEEAEIFTKVYKFIAGEQKRKSFWTNFVFKRWFCIYNFLKENEIETFWTFDSDTLILTELSALESNFTGIDTTTQCNGICMNGFVTNIRTVKGYVDKINELFQRKDFLKEQELSFRDHPDWAFTEMRAFATYEQESGIRTQRSNKIIGGAMFDENICQIDDFEYSFHKGANRDVKHLFFENGNIYEKKVVNDELIRLNAINMSWVPLTLIEKVYNYSMYGHLPTLRERAVYFLKRIARIITH